MLAAPPTQRKRNDPASRHSVRARAGQPPATGADRGPHPRGGRGAGANSGAAAAHLQRLDDEAEEREAQAAVDAAGPSPIDAALAEAAAALSAEKSLDSVAAALERWRARARENVRRMQAAAAQPLAALAAPPERLRLVVLDQLQHWQLQRGPSPRARVRLPGVISPRRMARIMVGENNKAAAAGASISAADC